MNSHITVDMYPLQLSEDKFFQIFIPFHVIYNFSKIPYKDIVFIPSTGIYYQVVPVREQQLSILKPELDGFVGRQNSVLNRAPKLAFSSGQHNCPCIWGGKYEGG